MVFKHFVVVHAPRDSAKMSIKVKHCKISNYRLQELTDSVDTKNANPSGASRAMIVFVPLLTFTALIEFLWVRIFDGNPDKYTC